MRRHDDNYLRPNWYDKGPYKESPCIHCHQPLKWTGANSGVTWIPVDTPPDGSPREWWTCWENLMERGTYGQHEPWEAIPLKEENDDRSNRGGRGNDPSTSN